ncbi:MAG: hypothetical protein LC774_16240 [Acidobacteria bacterium]|nr:hypothetical protein [Acidobacteriota bacterium]
MRAALFMMTVAVSSAVAFAQQSPPPPASGQPAQQQPAPSANQPTQGTPPTGANARQATPDVQAQAGTQPAASAQQGAQQSQSPLASQLPAGQPPPVRLEDVPALDRLTPLGGVQRTTTTVQPPASPVAPGRESVPTPAPQEPPLSVPQVATDFRPAPAALPELGRVGVDMTEQRPLALAEVIALALKNAKDIEVARENVRIAEFDLLGARGVYDPRLTSTSYYERTEQPSSSFLSGGAGGSVQQSNLVGAFSLCATCKSSATPSKTRALSTSTTSGSSSRASSRRSTWSQPKRRSQASSRASIPRSTT